ncbi:hypothetical protein H0194_02575 [Corynebacterium incognita]|uniref:Uncharacterized protein n=1 Tax=Corynebacterium incognita TaxID=2754725 RepID=A0A7G7CQS1_9CORY|nr:hypothetical protein [Corynebacterium incognita]QNE89937.1 hypothetical protein H0194_02575 [Corynebacterium incognita]
MDTKVDEKLKGEVEKFTVDLTESLSYFTNDKVNFHISSLTGRKTLRIRLDQGNDEVGIAVLMSCGYPVLGIRPTFYLTWDSSESYLAVDSSSFEVLPYARKTGAPLFRVEYDRHKTTHPSSHIHVHAHSDEFTHLLGFSRKLDLNNQKKVKAYFKNVPLLSKFHFPTGGHRFRPCLEDVLEILRVEFNLDCDNSRWKPYLKHKRIHWRSIQTAAVVRDSPETALNVLIKEYGMPRPENWVCPSDNIDRLTRN